MSGAPPVQRCPWCGEQPMSRLRYMLLPGTRAKCGRCTRRIRADISRAKMMLWVLFGVVVASVILLLAETVLATVAGLVFALLVALGVDELAWRRVPWLRDEREQVTAQVAAPNTAGRAG